MKRRRTTRLGVVALALTLITMTMTGGTLAKYTAEVTGDTTATVAKFAFDLNGASEQTDSAAINLSDMFSNTYNNGLVKTKESGTGKLVAPGTSGRVKIELKNKGDVQIKPDFTITETNANSVPLQYAITDSTTAPTGKEDWKKSSELTTTKDAVAVDANKTFYLHWRWNTTDDETDTALGIKGTLDTVKIEIKCTVSQNLPAAN